VRTPCTLPLDPPLLLATKIQWPEAVEIDPSFSFLYENNIHHFDLILLPGLTLHTETNDVTANLKKKKKHPRKGL